LPYEFSATLRRCVRVEIGLILGERCAERKAKDFLPTVDFPLGSLQLLIAE
jgi:hypothetical protein